MKGGRIGHENAQESQKWENFCAILSFLWLKLGGTRRPGALGESHGGAEHTERRTGLLICEILRNLRMEMEG